MEIDKTYRKWLEDIKQKIKAAQLKVAVSVNTQLIEMYWLLAEDIVKKQQSANWGDAVLEQLSFPTIVGDHHSNLYTAQHVVVPFGQQLSDV